MVTNQHHSVLGRRRVHASSFSAQPTRPSRGRVRTMSWFKRWAVSFTGVILLAGPLLASDWPRWRGPNADGVADGRRLPLRWSRSENVRWSAKLPGWGTSSPVVHGNKGFVTSQAQE